MGFSFFPYTLYIRFTDERYSKPCLVDKKYLHLGRFINLLNGEYRVKILTFTDWNNSEVCRVFRLKLFFYNNCGSGIYMPI